MSSLITRLKNCISLAIIHIFNIFPIQKNKIFLFSYYGSQYGCNPKYITEYILNHVDKGKFDLVWALNETSNLKNLTGIRIVRTMSLSYFYELCTSKIIITNYRTTDLFVKRKDQYYIQTWHSSLRLKQVEKDAEGSLPQHYIEMARKDSLKCDLLLSGCRYSTEIIKRSFWYDGQIFEHGTPRNDTFFQNNSAMRMKVLDRLKIPRESKIILYAPTFRKNNNLDVYDLNYSKILETLKRITADDWVFLVKLHPHLITKSSQIVYGNNITDVTTYHDIQELLSISDILISDYSSVIFDFSLTGRPCFLYVPDFMDYINNDRKLYFDLMELPFINSHSKEDLLSKIENFNNEDYENNLTAFLNNIGTFEEGRACEILLEHISEVCFSRKREAGYEEVQGRIYNRSL